MKYLVMFFTLVTLAACSANMRYRPALQALEPIMQIQSREEIAKALYSGRSNTLYVQSRHTQFIQIFRDQKLINSVGGLGVERSNFRQLSDIDLDSDGGILALDSIDRKLQKYSSQGHRLGEIELKGSVQPKLFARTADQALFVYDAVAGEIVSYSALNYQAQYSFGKFRLYRISSISAGRDFVSAYSEADKISHIYSVLGQYVESIAGQVVFDEYDNSYVLLNGIITCGQAQYALGSSQAYTMAWGDGSMVVFGLHDAQVLKPVYERIR